MPVICHGQISLLKRNDKLHSAGSRMNVDSLFSEKDLVCSESNVLSFLLQSPNIGSYF